MASELMFSEKTKTPKVAIAVLFAMFFAGFILWLLLYPIVNGSSVFWAVQF